MNNGAIHTVNGLANQIGKYGAARVGTYNLFPKFAAVNFYGDALLFDQSTNSFIGANTQATTHVSLAKQMVGGKALSLSNMPYKAVDILQSETDGRGSQQAFTIMQSTTDNSYWVAQIPFTPFQIHQSPTLFANFNQLPEGCLLPQADARICAPSGNFLYFGKGNKVYYHMNAPGITDPNEREKVVVTLPAGETVAHLRFTNASTLADVCGLNILTNSATGWKLYNYRVGSIGNPELQDKPQYEFSGQGTACFVFFRMR